MTDDSDRIAGTGRPSDPLASFPRPPVQAATGRDQQLSRDQQPSRDQTDDAPDDVDQMADAVLARIRDKLEAERDPPAPTPSVDQAITLREQAPELYDLWLKIAQEKAATANYVDRAPYEVPERLAQSGRPRALGALIVVLAFCGYLAWLGGPGPYIAGLIAILDLVAMLGMFFGLRPTREAEPRRPGRPGRPRGKPLTAQADRGHGEPQPPRPAINCGPGGR